MDNNTKQNARTNATEDRSFRSPVDAVGAGLKALISIAPLIIALLAGCAAQPIQNQAADANAELQDQQNALAAAQAHLCQASARLSDQPDPHRVGDEVSLASAQITRAIQLAEALRKDVADLGGAAIHLKAQIDAHKDDLLGPRGKRIRNRVIVVAVLITLGIILLQVGPLFGGPFGAGVVVAGHVLTICAWPLLRGLWAMVCFAGSATASLISNLFTRCSVPGPSSSLAPAPVIGS